MRAPIDHGLISVAAVSIPIKCEVFFFYYVDPKLRSRSINAALYLCVISFGDPGPWWKYAQKQGHTNYHQGPGSPK